MDRSGRWKNPALSLYRLFWTGIDWLYPPECASCGRPGVRWCEPCRSSLVRLEEGLCPVCGNPGHKDGPCLTCRSTPPHYLALRSFAHYSGALRTAIHRLKYEKDVSLAEALATHLIDMFSHLNWPVDLITAVPLNQRRYQERGYNQSALLAIPLALSTGKPYQRAALERIRYTPPQVGLNAVQRRLNMQGAFRADPRRVQGKIALVIDDVTTTGATLSACSEALLDAGAKAVYGLTLARAARLSDSSIDRPEVDA